MNKQHSSSSYIQKQKSSNSNYEESKQYTPISDEEMTKKILINFNSYGDNIENGTFDLNTASDKHDFSIFFDFQKINDRSSEEICYKMLTQIFDANKQHVENYLSSYIKDLFKKGIVSSPSLGSALTKYLASYGDSVLDTPLLKEWIAKIIVDLISADCLKGSEITFFKIDDD